MGRIFKSDTTILASAARTVAGETSSFKTDGARAVRISIPVTVKSTADALQCYIEGCSTSDGTYYKIAAFDPLTLILAAGISDKYTKQILFPPKYIKVTYTIAGGSVTFSIIMSKTNEG